jgi:glycosyltransferase involved in cell wall biosynthesis
MRTLVLVTSRFPYRPGEEFLEAELPYLASAFDRVVIVPCVVSGTPREVPPHAEIETGLGSAQPLSTLQKVLLVARHPMLFGYALLRSAGRPLEMRRAITRAADVAVYEEWFSRFLVQQIDKSESVLFFCWWMTLPILAVRLASGGRRQTVGIVSRPQRFDLYVDEGPDPNWPFHDRVLKSLDRAFVASEHGLRYLIAQYPWMAAKAEVGRLGTEDFGVKQPPEARTSFVVCSCAYLNPVKRLHLVIGGLGLVGARFPGVTIHWHHFGDGPLRSELDELVRTCLPRNVVAIFHGRVDNVQVRSFYRDTFVDVFVNTSSSEGVPVSIMEAQCAGIPVIATAVCGTPEVVSADNGVLLPPNPNVGDVAAAIGSAISEPELWLGKRAASRRTWQTLSDARENYSRFVDRLRQLFGSPLVTR